MSIDLSKVAKERKIKYFLISYVDLFGHLRAKLVPAQAIAGMQRDGAGFAGFATWLDMTPAHPDLFSKPDPESLIQLPWKPEVGWLAGDLWMDGKPVDDAPRNLLKRKVAEAAPLCVSPSDLYTVHAREVIGRLLEGWLAREKTSPFELLHRPDLIEKLDAAGMELQHAVQKIAVPESQERGLSVHEVMRHYMALVQSTIDRVLNDARKRIFPNLGDETFAAAATRLAGEPDSAYVLSGGVAQAQLKAPRPTPKPERTDARLDARRHLGVPPSGPITQTGQADPRALPFVPLSTSRLNRSQAAWRETPSALPISA